jgi:hypothetical protein
MMLFAAGSRTGTTSPQEDTMALTDRDLVTRRDLELFERQILSRLELEEAFILLRVVLWVQMTLAAVAIGAAIGRALGS